MSDVAHILKIVMVGQTRSGKSSLLTRFCENEFRTEILTTIGVDFKIKVVRVGDRNIKLQIWDTSGQGRFRTINTSYYRGASAVVLVYGVNDRGSFEAMGNYLRDIKSYNTNATFTLIANKIDVIDRIISQQEGRDFAAANDLQYFQTSAQSGQGVESCFQHIAQAAVEHYLRRQQSESLTFVQHEVQRQRPRQTPIAYNSERDEFNNVKDVGMTRLELYSPLIMFVLVLALAVSIDII